MAKGRRYRWLTPENRRLVEERLAGGVVPRVIAEQLGCSARTVVRARADAVVRAQRRRADSGFRLSIEERIEIGMRVGAGETDAEIARGLGRHRSTIGRELLRCGNRRDRYAPFAAERRARQLACRPKPTKLSRCSRLLAAVEEGLSAQWSPEQISAKLRVDHPVDQEMRISPETIYQSLFVQSRGELRRQLRPVQFVFVERLLRLWGNADPVVRQAKGILENKTRDTIRVHEREARRGHTTGRVTQDGNAPPPRGDRAGPRCSG
jgi:IS30 family transposase